jgi:aminomethyltransferase
MIPQAFESWVLETPFHRRTAAACKTNDWGRWAGYTTVNCYSAVELEYFAIRNAATLFDMSPMIKYRVTGAEAEACLNRLVTRDVAKLAPGRVAYSVWCDDDGKVLDDGTLFRLGAEDFRLCAQERHWPWLIDCAAGFDVEIHDESEALAGLALQGPTSCAVLKRLGLPDIETLRPFGFRNFPFEGTDLMVSRTGFTGDLGYELWVDPASAEMLWDRVMAAGEPHGITPIGSHALDLARIEAGFIATNADFVAAEQALRHTRRRSPLELGLGWLVDFDKGHFNGRRALIEERRKGPRRCLIGLDIEGNKAAPHALIYHKKTKEVGQVTSAMWSPTCKKNLALASLESPYGSEITDELWVEIYVMKELKWDKLMARCRVTPRPFFDHPRRRATPASDF